MENYQQVYDTVTEMICDAKDLERADLAPEMPLHQLKLDSLDYVELMVLAKREFGGNAHRRNVHQSADYDAG